jgi:PmbA protein
MDDLDVDRAATDAVDRATRLLGATKPASERLTVVLDPFVTAQFLGIVGATLSGEAVLKGRSLFADRVGEPVASDLVTFVDDPTNPEAFTATEADGEGLATRRNVLIDGGVLQGFVHNSYTGRRAGVASTASAVRSFSSTPGAGCQAISVRPGPSTQAELLAQVGEGLLVADVAGLHSGVNPVSGDFSTGADGLRIRGGELAEPVREVTIASTIQRMLQDVTAVGADLEWLPMSAAGVSLVVADVTMSGS